MAPQKSKLPSPALLIRPVVRKLQAYVPGEQPQVKGLIKLNTNENPYGPAPSVLAKIKRGVDDRLRLYPNPTADGLRRKLAQFHDCSPENLIVGNGSDELLALATRAFVEPVSELAQYAVQNATKSKGDRSTRNGSLRAGWAGKLGSSRYTVQYFHPSYSLYPVLAAIHGAWAKPVALGKEFTLPTLPELAEKRWDFQAALTLITTPNAPTGRGFSRAHLEELCREHHGVVILDEAYVDFAEESALELALRYPHVLVARTFSKAYALCFLRVGYFVGHPELIAALHKIRDSYNVNGLGQLAAESTLDALPHYRRNFRRIIESRQRLSHELAQLGFEVLPSQTNFILTRPPGFSAELWMQKLRAKKIVVRWFNQPEVREYLRITIGTETEMAALVRAVRSMLRQGG